MKYKEFSSEIWDTISKTLDQVQKQNPKVVAAFDADGTLWDTDLGESFFKYKIENKLVPLPKDPWAHYHNMKKINNDPRGAYVWLAQILKGVSIQDVRKWSRESFAKIEKSVVFKDQQKLINLFKSRGVQVYVVTASIKWAVEPGAVALGLTEDDVLGIQTAIVDNKVSDQPYGVITYKEGKVEALLQKTSGSPHFFASGNSEGDIALLESATHLRLVVSAATDDRELAQTEKRIMKHAQERGWLHHSFIS